MVEEEEEEEEEIRGGDKEEEEENEEEERGRFGCGDEDITSSVRESKERTLANAAFFSPLSIAMTA